MGKRATTHEATIGGEAFAIVGLYDLDPDFRKDPKTQHFCCLCQRDIKTPISDTGYVHMIEGGMAFLAIADEARYNALPDRVRAGDMYSFPVGPDCAKKFPKGFVHCT
jgi:hypothetical protein